MNDRIVLIAACALALLPCAATAAGDPEAGRQKAAICQTCHGIDGNSTDPQFPRLAGQYPDYLVQALTEYKSGERKNPIMANFATNLSPRDMENLASFFASQPVKLFVLK